MEKTLSQEKLWLFEKAPIWKAVMTLAVPTVVSQLIMTIYNLADSFFVGQLDDPNQLAAVALAFPMQLIMTAIANLFGVGGGVVISRALGSRDTATVKRASAFAVYGVIVLAAVCAVAATVFRSAFLTILGTTPELYAYTNNYVFWVLVIGGIPSTFNMAVAHLIRAEGASKEAGLGLSLGGILNMILDPIFIFDFGFGMEVKGAAVATCIANCVASIYFLAYLYRVRHKTMLSLHPAHFTLDRSVVRAVLLGGLPSALQMLMSCVSNLVLNNVIVGFSEEAIAGVGICKKVESIPCYSFIGITQGVVPLLAYSYGSDNRERMREGMRFTLGITIGLSLIFIVIMQWIPDVIASWFIQDTATIQHAATFIRIHCLCLPFVVTTFLLVSFFQATKRSREAAVLSVIRKGILDVPAMFLLNAIVPLYGPVMCQPIMDFVSAVCAVVMYFRGQKKNCVSAADDKL